MIEDVPKFPTCFYTYIGKFANYSVYLYREVVKRLDIFRKAYIIHPDSGRFKGVDCWTGFGRHTLILALPLYD